MVEGLVNLSGINQKLTNFDEAINLILSLKKYIIVKTEKITLSKSIGRILSKKLITLCDNPPADISSMDGYAIKKRDSHREKILQVIDESSAGSPSKKKVSTGQAVRIFTGGIIPEGTNKVIIQENVKILSENKIRIIKCNNSENTFIRKKGTDFKKGNFIERCTILSPRDLLLFASMGYGKFEVYKKLKISILSIGNELLEPGKKIKRNKIYASNAYGISGLLKKYSCKCEILPISEDTILSISKNLINALKNSDLIITIGGASVGNYDLVKDAIKKMGGKFIFEKVNIRPGKPTFAGILNKKPIIGLPGNPVSSYVCTQLFVIPLIEEIFNLRPKKFSLSSVHLNSDIQANGSRMHFMRGNVFDINQKKIVSLKNEQDSSLTKTLQESNCLVIRPPFDPAKVKGDKVDIIKLI